MSAQYAPLESCDVLIVGGGSAGTRCSPGGWTGI